MIDTVTGRFERLLMRDPFAPAVVMVRPGARDRVWVRAAIEHRAVRLAGLCTWAGLPSSAHVAFEGSNALDRMAAAFFILCSGRTLVIDGGAHGVADHVADMAIDDAFLAHPRGLVPPFTLRGISRSCDPAALLPRPVTHGELAAMVLAGRPPDGPMGEVLTALATGEPLAVNAGCEDDARATYAA